MTKREKSLVQGRNGPFGTSVMITAFPDLYHYTYRVGILDDDSFLYASSSNHRHDNDS